MSGTEQRGTELGAFMRSRREAVRPARVGLPEGDRRRTPGLRRAELATLAGVSVEYLTRLEQGRDRHPSAQVLTALADALLLTPDERRHLHLLAKEADGAALCAGVAGQPARSVRPNVLALLDRLEPTPAVVLNQLGDQIAHTVGYRRLAGPVGMLDGDGSNVLRFLFTEPAARSAYPDWEQVADEHVAEFKATAVCGDSELEALIDELTVRAGHAFTDRFAAPLVSQRSSAAHRVVHPETGELRLARETLTLPDSDHQRLVVYLPADDATAAALDRLVDRRPGQLRVVTS